MRHTKFLLAVFFRFQLISRIGRRFILAGLLRHSRALSHRWAYRLVLGSTCRIILILRRVSTCGRGSLILRGISSRSSTIRRSLILKTRRHPPCLWHSLALAILLGALRRPVWGISLLTGCHSRVLVCGFLVFVFQSFVRRVTSNACGACPCNPRGAIPGFFSGRKSRFFVFGDVFIF